MDKQDVLVIGGGLGGLISAAVLARAGRKVCLIEQHTRVGGYATTFVRHGYHVEMGLHQMDGLDELDYKKAIFNELGVLDNLAWVRVPEFCQVVRGSKHLIIPNQLDKAVAVLTEQFPLEEKGIRRFFTILSGIRKDIKLLYPTIFKDRPLLNTLAKLTYPVRFPYLFRYQNQTLGKLLDSLFTDQELKLILASSLGYYHDDPYSLSILFFSLGTGSFIEGGGYFLKGGSQKLSNYLADLIRDAGGEILLGHRVTRILTTKKKVLGVEYRKTASQEGEAQRLLADYVIANAAAPEVFNELLADATEKELKRANTLVPGLSMLSLFIVLKKPLKEYGWKTYNTFVLDPRITNLRDFKLQVRNPQGDFSYFMFCDYSHLDSGLDQGRKAHLELLAVDYLSQWEDLSSEEYKVKKEQLCAFFLEKLEQYIPGIKQEVEYYELATPKTMKRYTKNSFGSIYGYAQIPSQGGLNRETRFIKRKNLYYASAWAFPGGGFSGAVLSGYRVAQRILNR